MVSCATLVASMFCSAPQVSAPPLTTSRSRMALRGPDLTASYGTSAAAPVHISTWRLLSLYVV